MDIKKQLMRDEGRINHAYKDSLGYLTIGVGFLIDKKKGGRIPEPVIDFWLDYEISKITNELKRKWPFFGELNQQRQDALLNMAFNLGVNGLLNFKKTLALIEARDFDAASVEMLNSNWARQVGDRAKRLSRQIETGEYV